MCVCFINMLDAFKKKIQKMFSDHLEIPKVFFICLILI